MQTTPETAALLREIYERASIILDLDGPQLEAWVSGLFPMFDDKVMPAGLVDHCAGTGTEQGALLIAALAELTAGLDPEAAAHADQNQQAELLPAWATSIGTSELSGAWTVTAPFGRSMVLGFVNPTVIPVDESGDDDERVDLRHSILVELDAGAKLVDLQLAGPPKLLLDEATASDYRVVVAEIEIADALAAVVAAWPDTDSDTTALGSGFDANQQFVRRRMVVATGKALPAVYGVETAVDVRRGLNDDEFANANRAALSTLQAAVGLPEATAGPPDPTGLVPAWVAVLRGDVPDVSPRERDALLWLEWADWLGAGIGLLRAGAGSSADGETLVDHVNRCPEVSSSIAKDDREYAAWAFDVALDLLQDRGAITEDGQLSTEGHQSLWHALVAAWS